MKRLEKLEAHLRACFMLQLAIKRFTGCVKDEDRNKEVPSDKSPQLAEDGINSAQTEEIIKKDDNIPELREEDVPPLVEPYYILSHDSAGDSDGPPLAEEVDMPALEEGHVNDLHPIQEDTENSAMLEVD
jgi:hypothetical protein